VGSDLLKTLRLVLANPLRLRRLFALGPSGLVAMTRFLGAVVPRASRALRAIERRAAAIPDPLLRAEALASIQHKAYHVQGGSILATFLSREDADRYVAIVAPLETIYDYLDNLCDRLEGVPERAYSTLHDALLDAVDPARPLHDWYRDGPHRDDGGYLGRLVDQVREGVGQLPSLAAVQPRLIEAARFYAELQTFKHYASGKREAACAEWYARNAARFPGLQWWEFAAACGSSLPAFAMIYLATRPRLDSRDVDATFDAYFPNISAVHILLDYFIDQAEDREHRELNFVACYADGDEAVEGVRRLLQTTIERLRRLETADPHEFLLRAMCLFYLSHPKVFEQKLDRESAALLAVLG
jgi:tetraprenyl-beta-curcumene synthase